MKNTNPNSFHEANITLMPKPDEKLQKINRPVLPVNIDKKF